jgi:type IV pilus assembly protein PilC|tara:strand:- start:10182 stop:11312 length:1131 start_codon:yes stop_codon:yes gene_type:complete
MGNLPPHIAKQRKGKNAGAGVLSKEIKLPFLKEVPDKEVIEFTRNLAVMLKAKLPLVKALDTTIKQISHSKFKTIVEDVRKQVKKGQSLSKAFAKHPTIFDTIYVQLAEVGEVSGVLDDILLRLSAYQEKAHKLKQRVRMALVYPSIIVGVAVSAVTFLLVFVVPTFVDMYQDFNAELPGPTKIILSISEFLTGNILLLSGALVLLMFGFSYFSKTLKGSNLIDRAKLGIPYFGELYKKSLVGQITKTLATLLQSGVTLSESMRVLKNSSTNSILTSEVQLMSKAITKGKSLNKSLENSVIFPIIVTQMISVGEETASLDDMLNQVADLFEEEVDIMVEGLTSVIEPVLIVFIGLILGAIIVALYLPIFELVNVVG